MSTPSTTNDVEEKLTKELKALLKEAKTAAATGKGSIEIEFHQGGVTGTRIGLVRVVK